MSCKCVRIELREIPRDFPEVYKDKDGSGRVSLDLRHRRAKFSISKTQEEAKATGGFGGDSVFGFDLPDTPKNRFILKRFANVGSFDFDFTSIIPVTAYTSGKPLRQNVLAVQGCTSEGFDTKLKGETDFWLDLLSNNRLCDIDFNKGIQDSHKNLALPDFRAEYFHFTKNKVEDNQLTNSCLNTPPTAPTQQTFDSVWFPFIDYCRTVFSDDDGDFYSPSDLRPLFSVPYALSEMFCNVGWEFQSDFFEIGAGRCWWAYWAKPRYLEGQGFLGNGFRFIVNRLVGQVFAGDGSTTNVAFDVTNSVAQGSLNTFDLVTNVFTNPLDETIKFKFTLTYEVRNNSGVDIDFDAIINAGIPPTGSAIAVLGVTILDSTTVTVVLESGIVEVQAGASVGASFRITDTFGNPLLLGQDVDIQTPSQFEGEIVDSPILTLDSLELLNANAIVDCKHLALDLLNDVLILTRGVLETDFLKKRVTHRLYQDATFWDNQVIRGHFRSANDNPIILTAADIVCKSKKSSFSIKERNRFVQLAFKSSSDDFIRRNNFEEPDPFLSKRFDLGADKGFKEGTDVVTLRMFEPTANRVFTNTSLPQFPYILPAMCDNDNEERAFNLGARLLFGYGGEVRQLEPNTLVSRTLRYDEDNSGDIDTSVAETARNLIPFAAQVPFLGNDTVANILDLTSITPSAYARANIAFGDFPDDLGTLLNLQYFLEQLGSVTAEYLVRVDLNLFDQLVGRRRVIINQFEGTNVVGKSVAVRDFQPCTLKATPIVIVPDRNVRDICPCTKPCNCEFRQGDFFQPFTGENPTSPDATTMKIGVFELDGVNVLENFNSGLEIFLTDFKQIASAIAELPDPTDTAFTEFPYHIALILAVNSVNHPFFTAIQTQTGNNLIENIKFKFPNCQNFVIEVRDVLTNNTLHSWTQDGYFAGLPVGAPTTPVSNIFITRELL